MRRRIVLHRASAPGPPAFDTALSRALLLRASSGEGPETLRLYQPDDVVAFSVLDRTRPGFQPAVTAARALGCAAVLRLAGGHAALFHRETLAFAWSVPAEQPRDGIGARFDEMAELTAAALRRLGVDARVGEVAGEYCPGAHSVNARGRTKLMGVGQRVVRGAAHVGGVIVVRQSARVRDVLGPVYAALGIAWDPATAGSVEDEVEGVTRDAVAEALLAEFAERYDLIDAELPRQGLALAARLEGEHGPAAGPARASAGAAVDKFPAGKKSTRQPTSPLR